MPKQRRVAVMLDLIWPYKWHSAIFAGTQHYAQEQGWHSIIDEYADDTIPARPTKSIPYDGVIARATRKLARRATRLKLPIVNVMVSSYVWKTVPSVFPDLAAMGRLRADHLLARGFRRFAALSTEKDRAEKLEMKAFARTLAEAGFPCVTSKVPRDITSLKQWRKTERAITDWMEKLEPPIGVFVGYETHGRMVVQICRERGWRVPEDLAIIAGWNEETLCESPRPTLTSLEVGHERIGYEAARLLHRLMDGEAPPTEPIVLPPKGLVVRESTDFYAVNDELIASALEFIAANCHMPIGADDVARAVTTGTRTLQRRFRKYLNQTIAAEIRRVRIERAKRELAQSERPLSAIARAVGFGEAMRMYEVFRRELGVTPSDYRRASR